MVNNLVEHDDKICFELVQRRAARYAGNRYHNTSSVTDMLQTLTWPTLQQRRLKTKLIIMFYKIVHHIVAVPTTILIPTDPRIRQFHPFTYRHLHAFKDPYSVIRPKQLVRIFLWLKLFTISFLFKFVIVNGWEQLVLAVL
jgi:hypothetical protein